MRSEAEIREEIEIVEEEVMSATNDIIRQNSIGWLAALKWVLEVSPSQDA